MVGLFDEEGFVEDFIIEIFVVIILEVDMCWWVGVLFYL